jgi:hypothetical protein
VYVLTRRFPSLPLEEGCIELVSNALVYSNKCAGRYLVVKSGVYASKKPARGVKTVYIAEGLPLRIDLSTGRVAEGLDLFRGFFKRGLWKEVAPSFYAAVSTYAARCTFCTALIEARLKSSLPPRAEGVAVEVVKKGGLHRFTIVAPPGRSHVFKELLVKIFDAAAAIGTVELGVPATPPLTLYMEKMEKKESRKTTTLLVPIVVPSAVRD